MIHHRPTLHECARIGAIVLLVWPAPIRRAHAAPLSPRPAGTAAARGGSGLAPPHPWRLRERRIAPAPASNGPGAEVSVDEARGLAFRRGRLRTSEPARWPSEPDSPAFVVPERFAHALAQLCSSPSAALLGRAILDAAVQFAVDPFLLAALAYQQSGCDPRHADDYGLGLTRLHPEMLQRNIRGGLLRFGRPDGEGGFEREEIPVSRYAFSRRSLREPAPNLYFAAAMLRTFSEQCPEIDRPFGSEPHRHFVSHFVWGDRVRATLAEDEILIARRRLLDYYAPQTRSTEARVGALSLGSPLDGPPRILMGVMGDLRDGGRRIHLGIDLGATRGEPVRAMAAGVVTFAGADLRARGLIPLDPSHAEHVARASMGPRGLFVRIAHADGVETLYAHLDRYFVRAGQPVQAGELLGEVGRTGMHTSGAHLHLGLFVDGIAVDPGPILDAYTVRAVPLYRDAARRASISD